MDFSFRSLGRIMFAGAFASAFASAALAQKSDGSGPHIIMTGPPPPAIPRDPLNASPMGTGRPHNCSGDAYPVAALQRGAEGTTTLAFTIRRDGSVSDIKTQTSSGDADLDATAVSCAAKWLYRPALKDGVAIEAPWLTRVVFQIPAQFAPPFDAMTESVRVCVVQRTSPSEAKTVTLRTVVHVVVDGGGAVSAAYVLASSGNPTLDQRLIECWTSLPPDTSAPSTGKVLTYGFDWHLVSR